MSPFQGLKLTDIVVERMGLPVVKGIDLEAPTGQITVLLGPNGAGRTTLLEAISGSLAVRTGSAQFNGLSLPALSPTARTLAGLGHVEQGRTIFASLTVEENLLVTAARKDIGEAFKWFPELEKRRRVAAGLLSGGEQQMLVISRSLLLRPKLLMIDEMSLGLSPIVVRRLLNTLRTLVDDGLGVLLVEQYAHLALSYGQTVYVMSGGQIVLREHCANLIGDQERLHEAYLAVGKGDEPRADVSRSNIVHHAASHGMNGSLPIEVRS